LLAVGKGAEVEVDLRGWDAELRQRRNDKNSLGSHSRRNWSPHIGLSQPTGCTTPSRHPPAALYRR